ASSP
ncbi:hypothetical protein TYRP_008254, partial [Tyrophagus putrescentiae]